MPNGLRDDYFWMLATTLSTARVKPALVLSNDLMRDHRVAMLAPLSFQRWRARHIVHFNVLVRSPVLLYLHDIVDEQRGSRLIVEF